VSGPDDRDTLDPEAANDTEPPPPPPSFSFFVGTPVPAPESSRPPPFIPAGHAAAAFNAALDDLTRAFQLVEATGMAAARALDDLSKWEGP
jgi:hypothetical protein